MGRHIWGAFHLGKRDISIIHTYGHSNAVLLLKITSNGESEYQFFEVTEFNESYWAGQKTSAIYDIETNLTMGPPYHQVFIPVIGKN